MGNVVWSEEAEDTLISDLGEVITARDAMRMAGSATQRALNEAVRDAGLAVSRTVNRSDPAGIVNAREAIAECRVLMDNLKMEQKRARAAIVQSDRVSWRAAQVVEEIRIFEEEIAWRRRNQS